MQQASQHEHVLALLGEGVTAWNTWRRQHKGDLPVLDGIELKELDLSGIDFSELSFKNAKIERCQFPSANFISADLSNAVLRENNFSSAKMIAAVLDHSDLSGSCLSKANLLMTSIVGAQLEKIDFRGHDLSSLNFSGASLVGSNLAGQNLSCQDLSGCDLSRADLTLADVANANLNSAILTGANLTGTNLQGASFRATKLDSIDLSGLDLQGSDFEGASLRHCNLQDTNLSNCNLKGCDISGARLWKMQNHDWDISGVKCEYAFWDKEANQKTEYSKREFERMYAKSVVLELNYPHRLTANELTTLPILIEHLEASFWGIELRLKSIVDIAGGSFVSLVVDEAGSYQPSELKAELQLEANRIQAAQLALRYNPSVQFAMKEEIARLKERIWPNLLELAAEHERQQVRNLTVVFMDLKGFTQWSDEELTEKLSLFRGLIKPILNKWRASYPNMEGDSLRATFRNATAGLACACMMRDVLTSAGFELRIGVELGEVSVVYNEVTEQSDLEGRAVSMASRMEASAETGQVLVSERVRHYTHHRGFFTFYAERIKLAKGIGDKNKGDVLTAYSVQLSAPIQSIS